MPKYGEKTDNDVLFERAVAFKTIATKAEELQKKGALPFEVRSFIQGANKELANQAPDPEMYSKALKVAATRKAMRNEAE
jgi:hypothetical protein